MPPSPDDAADDASWVRLCRALYQLQLVPSKEVRAALDLFVLVGLVAYPWPSSNPIDSAHRTPRRVG